MTLSTMELNSLYEDVVCKIKNQLEQFNRNGELNLYLKSIRCDELIEHYNTFYNQRNAKILVIGASMIDVDNMKKIAKICNIDPSRLEFHLDYQKNKHFDISFLRNNPNYSDIIIGPNPHNTVGTLGYSSMLSLMTDKSKEYPKVTCAIAEGKLKITRTSFKKALENTQIYLDNLS